MNRQYGITNGCELAIVTRPFVRDPALLVEFGPNGDSDPESNPDGGSDSEPDIKSESEQSAVARVKYPGTYSLHLFERPADDQKEQHPPCQRCRLVNRKASVIA